MAINWSASEIDSIVQDYFFMLEHEQMGRAFSKAEHWRALMKIIGRTKGSIERKHMNISAVLDALGLPFIDGYKPLKHYQQALFEAVEVYLSERPHLQRLLAGETEALQYRTTESIFGETIVFDQAPPLRETQEQDIPEDIERIVSRFEHPAERDARNRDLGRAGELLVCDYERRRLQTVGRSDLSARVRWVTMDDGDGFGYGVRSFSGQGDEPEQELWLEVKTTNGSAATPFCVSKKELRVSEQRPDAFRIIRLYDFRKQVRAYCLAPPLVKHVWLYPTIYRAFY